MQMMVAGAGARPKSAVNLPPLGETIETPPRLSVVIPNYNYGDFIEAAIQSALDIDWPNLEVIVVDDGSTDGSAKVIESFGDRIRAVFQANASQRAACNVGFAMSTGEAVLFLDSDDMVEPSIARELFAVWNSRVSKVQFQMRRMDENGTFSDSVFPAYRPLPSPAEVTDWMLRTTAYPSPPGSGNIYSRTFLQKILPLDAKWGSAADSACIVAAPLLGEVVTVRRPLVYYRIHSRQDSDLLANDNRFAREIARAQLRYRFSSSFFPETVAPDEKHLFKSLPLLQFRVASLRLSPKDRPLADDSWMKALVDCLVLPVTFPGARMRDRLILGVWCLTTLTAPLFLARKLISLRFDRSVGVRK